VSKPSTSREGKPVADVMAETTWESELGCARQQGGAEERAARSCCVARPGLADGMAPAAVARLLGVSVAKVEALARGKA
jgi:hypothetical protein